MMFARLDFSTFLICYSGDLSGNKSEEKASVAICGGSSHNLVKIDWPIGQHSRSQVTVYNYIRSVRITDILVNILH